MIQITANDPAKTPRAQLAIAIAVLQAFHDGDRAVNELAALLSNRTALDADAPMPPVLTLALADSPAAGAEILTPTEAFGSAGATEAFGAAPGNGLAVGSEATFAPTTVSSPPAAPSAPSVALVAAPAGVELDRNGLPWDVRIHAGTKGKNKDGTWTAKRGVDPALVTTVQAELRQIMSIPTPGNVPTPIDFAATTGAPATPPTPPAPPAPPAPAGTAAPAPVTTPPAPVGASSSGPAVTFPELAGMVGQLIPSGKLTQEKLTEICSTFGIANFGLMFNRPDLVPGVHAAIVAATGG